VLVVALGAVSALVAIAGAIGLAWAILRSKQIEKDVELLRQGIDDRDEALAFERTERERSEERCRVELAELRGQVEALTSNIVREIVGAVQDQTAKAVTSAVRELVGAIERLTFDRPDREPKS
jgi:hypothetical protein